MSRLRNLITKELEPFLTNDCSHPHHEVRARRDPHDGHAECGHEQLPPATITPAVRYGEEKQHL